MTSPHHAIGKPPQPSSPDESMQRRQALQARGGTKPGFVNSRRACP
jgi:hypothetical protein